VAVRLIPAVWWMFFYALFAGNAMYTLSVALEPVVPLSVGQTIWCVFAGVVLYTMFSGLIAAAYTSVIQCFLMIIGGLILLPLALKHPSVGGLEGFTSRLGPEFFRFWKSDPGLWYNYKGVLMFALMGLPYWCTSQYMLQRSFAGRSVRDASRGLILAAILTGPLTLSFIIPGMCGALIYDPADVPVNDSVLPMLVHDVLPLGLGGLILAALVAASNSTASALLSSLSTLGEHDFYRRFLPDRSSRQYVWVGRVAILLGGMLGLFFAFNVERLGGIVEANYEIMAFFEPPIFAIIAAALLWKRANRVGAIVVVVAWLALNGYMFYNGWSLADRALTSIPVFLAAMIVGTLLGNVLRAENPEARQRTAELFGRLRGSVRLNWRSPVGMVGVVLAVLSLAGFVFCSFYEEMLPRPENILIFMGLMMLFVLGCYLAVPVFVPQRLEGVEAEAGELEKSLTNRILGSGWSWLAMYLLAGALVVLLYLFV
jgi:SSS family solute:Na+ symporter